MKENLSDVKACIEKVDNGYCDEACEINKKVSKIHPYFAIIKPGIVSCIVDNLTTKDDVILDPFCGSGTTGIESSVNGRKVTCSDLNPVSSMITRAKITPLNKEALSRKVASIKELYTKEKATLDDIPDVVNRKHWFSDKNSIDLARLKGAIEKSGLNKKEIDVVGTSLSKTVKNASKGVSNFYLEYRKPKFGAVKDEVDVLESFSHEINNAIKNVPEKNVGKNVTVITSDSKDLPLTDGSVDMIITDPPYGSAIDYIHAWKLHINWLELGDHIEMKDKQIGNRTSKKSKCLNYEPKHQIVKSILDLFPYDSGKRRDEVYFCDYANYFNDMENALVEFKRVTKDNGKMVMRLGNNIAGFNGEMKEIPTTDAIIEIAESVGWNLKDSFYRDVDNLNASSLGFHKWKHGMKRERYMLFENEKEKGK